MRLSEVIFALAAMYPHSKVSAQRIQMTTERLADIPVEIVERAAERIMDTQDHFPTLRELRHVAAELYLALPDGDHALTEIEDRMAWARMPVEGRGNAPAVSPLVKQALDHVGGFHAFRASDEPTVVRGQFLRLYRELREAKINEVQIRAELPGSAANPQLMQVS